MCKLIENQSEFICTIPFWYRYVNILLENKPNNCYTFKGIFLFSCVHLHSGVTFCSSALWNWLQQTPEQGPL